MNCATIIIADEGWAVAATPSHPEGILFSGGYDAETNTVYLAGVAGHPQGMRLAGGDASKPNAAGLRLFMTTFDSGTLYWADDSFSLPRKLSSKERTAIQKGLEQLFAGRTVEHVARLQDIASI